VGDRRWEKIAHILQTSAFLNDRKEVDLMDCQLIEYCIWNTEKQQKKVREIVETCIQQHGLDCDTAIDEINEQIEEFEKIRLTIILIYLFISTIIYLTFMAMMIVKESLFTNKKFNLRIGLYSFLIATDILDIALLLRIFKTGFADKSLLIAAVAIAVGTILVGTALTFDDLVNRKRSLSIEETLKKTDNNMEKHV